MRPDYVVKVNQAYEDFGHCPDTVMLDDVKKRALLSM